MTLAPALTRLSPARPVTRGSRRVAGLLAVAFAVSSVGLLAAPRPADRVELGLVQLLVRVGSSSPDQPGAGERRAQGAQGRLDAHLGRPLAQQGHDHPRLLQPHHPGLRQGLGQAPRHRLLLQGRRREHRLEQLPRRHRDRRHPADCSWTRPATARTSWARPGTSSASAPTRARPARRCGRSCSPTSAARPTPKPTPKPTAEADAQADAEAAPATPEGDAATDPEADAEARRRRPAPTPAADPDRPDREPTAARPDGRCPATTGRRLDRRPPSDGSTTGRRSRPTATSSAARRRPPSPAGLLETIVGGVTGFFFGG